eukprot:938165-Pyramimonas_sp.AAC.1
MPISNVGSYPRWASGVAEARLAWSLSAKNARACAKARETSSGGSALRRYTKPVWLHAALSSVPKP